MSPGFPLSPYTEGGNKRCPLETGRITWELTDGDYWCVAWHRVSAIMFISMCIRKSQSPKPVSSQILQLWTRLSVQVTLSEVDLKVLSKQYLLEGRTCFSCVCPAEQTPSRGFPCNNRLFFCKTGVTTCYIYTYVSCVLKFLSKKEEMEKATSAGENGWDGELLTISTCEEKPLFSTFKSNARKS